MGKKFDQAITEEYRKKIDASGNGFFIADPEENSPEFAHFYFIGNWKGEEVVFDSALCTLRLQHENDLYELAEEAAEKQFPVFKKGNAQLSEEDEEIIGMFLAEYIENLQDDDQVKVKEFVDIDPDHEFGVSLDAALHVDAIDTSVIRKFVADFKGSTLSLDPTLYSFESEE